MNKIAEEKKAELKRVAIETREALSKKGQETREALTKKGQETRELILKNAWKAASSLGLEGVTVGKLAERLKISKSGLFAHFKSKEALQIAVLDSASEAFAEIMRPAVKAPEGEPRVRAVFEAWFTWGRHVCKEGGCPFAAASFELDDRPGPVREHLKALQNKWLQTRIRVVQSAIDAGHFRKDLDPEQFATDWFGIALIYLMNARLLEDTKAEQRARVAFERLITDAKTGVGAAIASA